MTQTTYDRGTSADDGWTSDRWADPSTVAAPWGPSLAELPPPVVTAPAPATTSRWPKPWVAVAIVLLAMLVGIFATRLLAGTEPTSAATPPRASAPAVPAPSAPAPAPSTAPLDPNAAAPGAEPEQGSGSSAALSEAAAKVAPSIVNITTTVGYDGNQAAGTGEVLTEDGYVLTNHHVIAGSTVDQGRGRRHHEDLRRRRRGLRRLARHRRHQAARRLGPHPRAVRRLVDA